MTEVFSHLVWLGANTASEPVGITNTAEQVILFDARAAACKELKQKFPQKNVTVIQAVLTTANTTTNFTEYSLAEFSAIQPATGLKKLFPGLKTNSSEQLSGTAISDAINSLKLSNNNNLLIVDIADIGLALLKAIDAAKQLHLFGGIYVQTANEPLYHNAATSAEIKAFLQAHGYVLQQTTSNDPALPWLSFGLNPLWASLQQAHQQIAEQKKALEVANTQVTASKQELQQREMRINELKEELAKVQVQKKENSLPEALEQKLQKMFADQVHQLTKEVGYIKNHINNGLGNTAKQLEAFMGLQNYLERGVKPLSFHGWPISPDIGLYITGLIDANNYDCIIEFGSGTSTVLMAKALISKQRGVQTKALNEKSTSNEIAIQENHFVDLPARIVTFEHNSLYHGKTMKALQENGVEHLVDLVHAPLVDYQYKDGSQYLYYNCSDKLHELSRIFKGRRANILVLVDGPPGATNKNARFPALPHLLNILPEHLFTILMDDYNRSEEKETVDIWKAILTERSMYPTLEVVPSEKGLSVLSTCHKN